MGIILIDRKLILANAPSNIGQQVHVNHVGCPSGEDTKRRLYIKRTDRGLVAYCHHCAKSGSAKDDNTGRLSSWLTKKEAVISKLYAPPVLAPLSLDGMVWLCKYYCDPKSDSFSGVYLKKNNVALKLHDPENTVIGCQVRDLVSNATPKYLTHYTHGSNNGDASWFKAYKQHLVITEDYLSAYRVAKDTNFASVALLRTTVSDRTLLQIHELGYKSITIWLDPDSAGIEGAIKVQKKLTHFLPANTIVRVLKLDKEPKECTVEELKTYLKETDGL